MNTNLNLNIDLEGHFNRVINAEDLIGRNIGIFGQMGSGKDNTAAVFAEEFLKNSQFRITTVNLDSWRLTLNRQFENVLAVGERYDHYRSRVDIELTPLTDLERNAGQIGSHNNKLAISLAKLCYAEEKTGTSITLDVGEWPDDSRCKFLSEYLKSLVKAATTTAVTKSRKPLQPHFIILPNAGGFLYRDRWNEDLEPASPQQQELKNVLTTIAKIGRSYGIGIIYTTALMPSQIDENFLAQTSLFLFHSNTRGLASIERGEEFLLIEQGGLWRKSRNDGTTLSPDRGDPQRDLLIKLIKGDRAFQIAFDKLKTGEALLFRQAVDGRALIDRLHIRVSHIAHMPLLSISEE